MVLKDARIPNYLPYILTLLTDFSQTNRAILSYRTKKNYGFHFGVENYSSIRR